MSTISSDKVLHIEPFTRWRALMTRQHDLLMRFPDLTTKICFDGSGHYVLIWC